MASRGSLLLALALILFPGAVVSWGQRANLHQVEKDEPGSFDYYVFAYSWTPEFCYDSGYPGCDDPQAYWGTDFTIHGLWPQYMAGGYPATCTNEAFDTSVPNEIGMSTMTKYWPNVQEEESSPDYDSFWEHEWTKHGTCTGLSQEVYFNTTIGLAESFGTPSQYTAAVGGNINADDLRNYLGGADKVALQCTSGKYVVGAFTCWSKTSNALPGSQVTCASDVQNEDTCTGDDLIVAGFSSRR